MGAINDYLNQGSKKYTAFELELFKNMREREEREEEERKKLAEKQKALNDETATVRREIGLDLQDSFTNAVSQNYGNLSNIRYNGETGLYESTTDLSSQLSRTTGIFDDLYKTATEKKTINNGSYDDILKKLEDNKSEYMNRIGAENYNKLYNEVSQKTSRSGGKLEGYVQDFRLGDIQNQRNAAWDRYQKTGLLSDKELAQGYDKMLETYRYSNPDVGKQTLSGTAEFLPQFVEQQKRNIPGSALALGALGLGTYVGQPQIGSAAARYIYGASTIASGAQYTMEQTRGGEFGDMVSLGIPEDIARRAAQNSAVLQTLIEEGETLIDLKNAFKLPQSKTVTNGLKQFFKNWGVNIVTEGLEEGSQSVVGFIYEKDAANRAGLSLEDYTYENMLSEAWEEAKGGAEIGATMYISEGIPHFVIGTITDRRNQKLSVQDAPVGSFQLSIIPKTDEYGNQTFSEGYIKKKLIEEYNGQIAAIQEAAKSGETPQKETEYVIKQLEAGKKKNTQDKAVSAITKELNKTLDAQTPNKKQKLSNTMQTYAEEKLKAEQEDARAKGFKNMEFSVASEITSGQKNIASFAKKGKVNVVYYTTKNGRENGKVYRHRGMWIDGDTIFINARMRTTKNVLSAIGHEYAHINYFNNEDVRNKVNARYSNEEAIAYGKSKGWRKAGFMSQEEINRYKEEMYADDVGEFLSQPETINMIESGDKSVIKDIENLIANFVENTAGVRPQFDSLQQYNLEGTSVLNGAELEDSLKEQVLEDIRKRRNERETKEKTKEAQKKEVKPAAETAQKKETSKVETQKKNEAWYKEQKADNRSRDDIRKSLAIRMGKSINSGEVSQEMARLEKKYNSETKRSAEIVEATPEDYSKEYKASDGTPITNGVARWAKNSKVRTKNGVLVAALHGSMANFEEFLDTHMGANGNDFGQGYYFTDSEDYAGYFGNTRKFILNIENPLLLSEQETDSAKLMALELASKYEATSELSIRDLKRATTSPTTYNILNLVCSLGEENNIDTRAILKEFGYDGIIDRGANYDTYIIFDSNQAKHLDNPNPTNNPDTRRSAEVSPIPKSTKMYNNLDERLSPGQMKKYKNSMVRDEFGRLMVVYHTTTGTFLVPFYIFSPQNSRGYRYRGQTTVFATDDLDMTRSYTDLWLRDIEEEDLKKLILMVEKRSLNVKQANTLLSGLIQHRKETGETFKVKKLSYEDTNEPHWVVEKTTDKWDGNITKEIVANYATYKDFQYGISDFINSIARPEVEEPGVNEEFAIKGKERYLTYPLYMNIIHPFMVKGNDSNWNNLKMPRTKSEIKRLENYNNIMNKNYIFSAIDYYFIKGNKPDVDEFGVPLDERSLDYLTLMVKTDFNEKKVAEAVIKELSTVGKEIYGYLKNKYATGEDRKNLAGGAIEVAGKDLSMKLKERITDAIERLKAIDEKGLKNVVSDLEEAMKAYDPYKEDWGRIVNMITSLAKTALLYGRDVYEGRFNADYENGRLWADFLLQEASNYFEDKAGEYFEELVEYNETPDEEIKKIRANRKLSKDKTSSTRFRFETNDIVHQVLKKNFEKNVANLKNTDKAVRELGIIAKQELGNILRRSLGETIEETGYLADEDYSKDVFAETVIKEMADLPSLKNLLTELKKNTEILRQFYEYKPKSDKEKDAAYFFDDATLQMYYKAETDRDVFFDRIDAAEAPKKLKAILRDVSTFHTNRFHQFLSDWGYNTSQEEILAVNGYDGVIFNKIEGYGSNQVEHKANNVYVAFASNQTDLISNKNPTMNPDIRRSAEITSEKSFKEKKAEIISRSRERQRREAEEAREATKKKKWDGRAKSVEDRIRTAASKVKLKDGYRIVVDRDTVHKDRVVISLQKDTYDKMVVEGENETPQKYETVKSFSAYRREINSDKNSDNIKINGYTTQEGFFEALNRKMNSVFKEGIKQSKLQKTQDELSKEKGKSRGRGAALRWTAKKSEQRRKETERWKARTKKREEAILGLRAKAKEKRRLQSLKNAKKDFLRKMKSFEKSKDFKFMTDEQKRIYNETFGNIYRKGLTKKLSTQELENIKAEIAKHLVNEPDMVVSKKIKDMITAPNKVALSTIETIEQLNELVDAFKSIVEQVQKQRELVGLPRVLNALEEQAKFVEAVRELDKEHNEKKYTLNRKRAERETTSTGRLVNALTSGGSKTAEALRNFFETSLSTIETELLRIAKGNRNSKIMDIYKNLNQGVTRDRSAQVTLRRILNKFLTQDKYKELRKQLNPKSDWVDTGVTVKDVNGKSHELILDHGRLISLAMHSMQEQSLKHIGGAKVDIMFDEDGDLDIKEKKGGGLTIPDMKLAKEGKIQRAVAEGYTVVLTPTEINKIVGKTTDKNGNVTFTNLSKEENEFIKGIQEFFEQTRAYTDEVYRTLRGFELPEIENYFPIVANKAYIYKTVKPMDNLTHKTIAKAYAIFDKEGFVQDRKDNAYNPIVLENVADVITRMTDGVSKYYGYNIALHNNNVLLTAITDDNFSVEDALMRIAPSFKKDYNVLTGFISGLMAHPSDLFAKFRGRHAEFTLGLNPSSWVKQLLSIPTTAKYFTVKELASFIGGGEKVLYDTLKEFLENRGDYEKGKVLSNFVRYLTNDLDYRSDRFGIPDMSDLTDEKSLFENIDIAKGIARFDRLGVTTVARMFLYAELGRRGLLGDELSKVSTEDLDNILQDIGSKLEIFLRQTQPDYSQVYRANITRNSGAIARFITMYSTPTLQMTNNLLQSYYELDYALKNGSDTDKKLALSNMAKSVAGVAVASLGSVLIARLFSRLLKGEEDDDYDFGKELTASMLAPTLVLDDLARGFMGMSTYESQVPELIAYDAFIEIASSLNEIATGKPENRYNKWKKIVTNLGMVFGIPARDIYKLGKAVLMYSGSDLYYTMALKETPAAYKKWIETEGSPSAKDYYRAYTNTRESVLKTKYGYHKADKENNIKSNLKESYRKALEDVFPNDQKKVNEYMTILGGYTK